GHGGPNQRRPMSAPLLGGQDVDGFQLATVAGVLAAGGPGGAEADHAGGIGDQGGAPAVADHCLPALRAALDVQRFEKGVGENSPVGVLPGGDLHLGDGPGIGDHCDTDLGGEDPHALFRSSVSRSKRDSSSRRDRSAISISFFSSRWYWKDCWRIRSSCSRKRSTVSRASE